VIAVRMRLAVSAEHTFSRPPTKRETVVMETPAFSATSLIVAFLNRRIAFLPHYAKHW
jgi:hypothetical protein